MSQSRQDSLFPSHHEVDCHDHKRQRITSPNPSIPSCSAPEWHDETQTAVDINIPKGCYGIDCPRAYTPALTRHEEASRSLHSSGRSVVSHTDSNIFTFDPSSPFDVSTPSDSLSPELEVGSPPHQDELWQALVAVRARRQDLEYPTTSTSKKRAAVSGKAMKFYPTVLLPSTKTLIVNMFASPNKTQSQWPDITQVPEIRFLHPAFTLTLYIANDELTFSFALGSFTSRFSSRQQACFARGANKMVGQALVQGVQSVLGEVSLLPAFAHMVYEWFDVMGVEVGVDWIPSEDELVRHWMVCVRYGWTCRRVV
ncbi:hypothetical protein M409DRAFT_29326 [Zasmidium cellare ATCC 36951]|uniref:Uncharacterized protein n=1 Tax=Zasmidium cellare ATCC 36951 TaxID=1080233 RepID=A0A6A6C4B6_ZASCE|nr:uncharacterized protein M409DRAFT_29326 [Zasmidium cellare ATCC 36951]KAF2160236.1 hypothetical protein M409DRAFT_29326 [Zasmidium cellare ATCC 36951]